jgi:folate-binding protein YgfZ
MPYNPLQNTIPPLHGAILGRPHAWLRVEGADATTFLQGQCTQDLRPLRVGDCAEALWLNTKGRILGESLVLRAGDSTWWLWSAHTPGELLARRLEDFIIADDVVVSPQEIHFQQMTLAGPAAAAWLRALAGGPPPPSPGHWRELAGGIVFAARRGLAEVWDWLRPLDAAPLPLPGTPHGERAPPHLHPARHAAGVPAIPGEFGPQDLPQEAGLEHCAISFQKGCYLGQEVMARLHSMGQVRRRLVRVGGDGPAPAPGLELSQGAKRLGELRASADDGNGGWLGLALLTLLGLDPSKPLLGADGRTLAAHDPLSP